jgi:hypothetical protein
VTFIQAAIFGGGGGGAGIQKVAPDSNDVAIWQLNEASAPFANSGSGAATAMSVSAGSITADVGERGEFGTAALVPETLCRLATSTAVPEPTQDITVSFWIFLFEYVSSGSYGRILMKQSDPSSWVSPYYSLVLYFTDALGTGRSIVRTATGSTIVEFSSGTVPLFQWNHLGLTYDGTTSRLYLNGSEIGNNSDGSGNMDWTDHGYWLIGSPVGQSTNWIHAMYQDIRIADVVRDAAWFEEVFSKGWG